MSLFFLKALKTIFWSVEMKWHQARGHRVNKVYCPSNIFYNLWTTTGGLVDALNAFMGGPARNTIRDDDMVNTTLNLLSYWDTEESHTLASLCTTVLMNTHTDTHRCLNIHAGINMHANIELTCRDCAFTLGDSKARTHICTHTHNGCLFPTRPMATFSNYHLWYLL